MVTQLLSVPAAILSCIGILSGTSAAADTYQDWSVECNDSPRCVLAQTVQAADRTWLGTVFVIPSSDGYEARAQFLVPAGVHLASGLFVIDTNQAPRSGTWIRCTSERCRAEMSLSADDLDRWRRGLNFELVYRPRPDVAPVRFPVSLNGITAGLTRLSEIGESNL